MKNVGWTNAQRVPSVEEIRAHMLNQEIQREGGDPVAEIQAEVVAETASKDLVMQKIAGLRRKPSELRKVMDIILDHYGVEPINELVKIALSADTDRDLRTKIWLELNAYRMPKLKAVEHTGVINHQHNIMIVRFGEDGKVQTEKKLIPTVHPIEIPAEVSGG